MGHECHHNHLSVSSGFTVSFSTCSLEPGCPTRVFLKPLATFDSLHLPLLGLCTHPHSVPLLVLSMQELPVGWCHVSTSQILVLPCYKAKLMLGKGVVNGDFVQFIQLEDREKGKVLISPILSWQYQGAQARVKESKLPALAGLGATEHGDQLTAACLLKVSQYTSSAFDLQHSLWVSFSSQLHSIKSENV